MRAQSVGCGEPVNRINFHMMYPLIARRSMRFTPFTGILR